MTTAPLLRVAVHGARGRMGRRVIDCAQEIPNVRVVAALDIGDADAWIKGGEAADVVIDFSSDAGAQIAARAALAKRAALLVGTTALSEATMALISEAAGSIPVLVAPNTSLGVAVIRHLVVEAAMLLGSDFDVDIVERHHRHKADAPSGTAKSLAQALTAANAPVDPSRVHAIRTGDVVGEHTVSFGGPGEVVEIRHWATSRDLFARGALTLAAWLVRRPPGMQSVDRWVADRCQTAMRGRT